MARKKASEKKADSSLAQAIRKCVDDGKVEFGANAGVKGALSGKAKIMVVSSNCPAERMADISRFCKLSNIPVVVYEGTSMELGTVAGRPHPISVLSVYDAGNSGILEFAK